MGGFQMRIVTGSTIFGLAIAGCNVAMAAGAQSFDGNWNVVIDCAQAPDGAKALSGAFQRSLAGDRCKDSGAIQVASIPQR
jgi:hypothetical protein